MIKALFARGYEIYTMPRDESANMYLEIVRDGISSLLMRDRSIVPMYRNFRSLIRFYGNWSIACQIFLNRARQEEEAAIDIPTVVISNVRCNRIEMQI